jgi:N-methylhydantoinase B
VEVTETRFPLFLERHEFREGSGGGGTHRGGDGGELIMRIETDGDAVANTAGDGVRHGARGVLGGADGLPHLYHLQAPGEAPRVLRTKEAGIAVPSGSRLHALSGGGGGWGAA